MKRVMVTTTAAVIIMTIFFYYGIFSPLKNELENSLKHNFLNKVSINELSIENKFDRHIEGTKSLSNRAMIKNKLDAYNNNQISYKELHNYTQAKYVDEAAALDNILAAYRITDGKIVAQSGQVNFEKIRSNFEENYNKRVINLIVDDNSVFINSPIINIDGEKIGNDITVFDLNEFIFKLNSKNINYDIIHNKNKINYSLGQKNQVLEYRKILDTNYWLKASESKKSLYSSLSSITTKIITVFLILLLSFLSVLYKTISSSFNNIIYTALQWSSTGLQSANKSF